MVNMDQQNRMVRRAERHLLRCALQTRVLGQMLYSEASQPEVDQTFESKRL